MDELRKAKSKTRDAYGADGFSPGVLIVGGDGENLLEEHLRCHVTTVSGKLGTAITTKHRAANDGGGETQAREPGEQSGLLAFEQGNGGERRNHEHAGINAGGLGESFGFANDAQAGGGGPHVP